MAGGIWRRLSVCRLGVLRGSVQSWCGGTTVVGQRPHLRLYYARSLFLAPQFHEALTWLDAAEGALTDEGTVQFTQHDGSAGTTSCSGLSEHERRAFLGRLLSYRAVVAGHYGESQAAG